MLVYVFINLFIMLVGILFRKNKPYIVLIPLFLLLLFFAGLRGDFTTDYNNYVDYFFYLRNDISFVDVFNKQFTMERGFVLLSKLIGFFVDSGWMYMFIVSAITLVLFFVVFRDYSEIPWLSVLLFVSVGDYYASFNISRNVLAAAITFYGVRYINDKQRDFWKFLVCILLAACFHRTAIVMLPMYWLLKIKVNIKNVFLYIIICCVIWFVLPYIVAIAQKLIPNYSNYQYGLGNGSFNAVIAPLAMLIFVPICIHCLKVKFDVNVMENRILINGSIWAVMFMFLGVQIFMITRFATYFNLFLVLLVPKIINSFKNKLNKNLVTLFICIISVLFVIITMSDSGYVPYYFSKEI